MGVFYGSVAILTVSFLLPILLLPHSYTCSHIHVWLWLLLFSWHRWLCSSHGVSSGADRGGASSELHRPQADWGAARGEPPNTLFYSISFCLYSSTVYCSINLSVCLSICHLRLSPNLFLCLSVYVYVSTCLTFKATLTAICTYFRQHIYPTHTLTFCISYLSFCMRSPAQPQFNFGHSP